MNRRQVEVYNPEENQDVTNFYMSLIGECFSGIGCDVRNVENLSHKGNRDNSIVVVDRAPDVLKAKMNGYKNIVFWMQGVIPEESYLRHKSSIRKHILSLIEGMGIKFSKYTFFVSDAMKTHVEKKYKCKVDNYHIMPCLNEQIKKESFYSNGKYENNSFVYVGGLQKWQCFEKTVEIYSQIEKSRNDICLYVYTANIDEAKKILDSYGIVHYHVDFVPKEKLNEELKKIKFGFTIRDDVVVNNVATPTKLSNYLSNGLIPVFTDAIHDFRDLMEKNKYKIVLKSELSSKEMGNEILLSGLFDTLDADVIFEEYARIFASYYSAERHKKMIMQSLNEVFAVKDK